MCQAVILSTELGLSVRRHLAFEVQIYCISRKNHFQASLLLKQNFNIRELDLFHELVFEEFFNIFDWNLNGIYI